MAQPAGRRTYDIDSLTDVALAVFARKGYDGASMDDVATAAGITKASIYHHVSGKEALLARGLGRALDALFAILDEPDSSGGRAVDRLQYVFNRVAQTTTALITELSILFRVRGNSTTELAALERRRRFDRLVADMVREAQHDGDVRSDIDARIAARLMFGLSNSIVEWYRPGGAIADAEVTRCILTLVFEGLKTPAALQH